MRFAIFSAGESSEMADMCAATIRHHHPHAEIVHLTDQDTPLLAGADYALRAQWRRGEESPIRLRARLLARLSAEPTLSLDSDTLVRANVDELSTPGFDIALTYRHYAPRYNAGVMISRGTRFWSDLCGRIDALPDPLSFTAIEEILPQMVRSGDYRVRELPWQAWNCWNMREHAIRRARIVHYKGARKKYMKQHFRRPELWQ